jgi:hypothetical protein
MAWEWAIWRAARVAGGSGAMADTSQRRRYLECPRCGAENLPTSKFCSQCGASLRGDAPAPPSASAGLPPLRTSGMLPYMPGAHGPGPLMRVALVFLVIVLIACVVFFYFFLLSGADRTPSRITLTPAALTWGAWGVRA